MYKISSDNLDVWAIAKSGQCFRMNEVSTGVFSLIAMGKVLKIQVPNKDECLLDCSEQEFFDIWENYFDLKTDYKQFIKSTADDEYLKEASVYGSGVRILNQDPWEMIISFIISQRKSIPAIKTSIEKLCAMLGEDLGDGYYSFPTVSAIAQASIEDLLTTSVGYRAKYLKETALVIQSGRFDIKMLSALDDDALLEKLLELSGVGKKVASCVMLFGFHRLGAFPEDVWINKIVANRYSGNFPREKYRGYEGVIQQYMFFYERYLEGKN